MSALIPGAWRGALAALGLLLLFASGTAQAADAQELPARWTIAPYAWVPNFSGEVGISGQKVTIDVDPEELAGSIKAGAMGYVRWVKGRHMLYAEGLGFDFEDRSLEQFNDLPTTAKALYVEAGYGYRIPLESALPNGGVITLTPYLGLRHASLDVAADVPFPFQDLAADEQWQDPVLGLFVEGPVRGRLSYALKIDGAGFGIGRDHYSSGALYFVYTLGEHWFMGAGYRISAFHAEPGGDNDLELRLLGRGPALGLAYTW